MSVGYEQEIWIKNFIEHFKNKQKVYGIINISIWSEGHSIDHQTYLDSDIEEAEQIGFEDGQDLCMEHISIMSAADLSEHIDEETAIELYEYYKDKR
jgi:hypothetical protein